LVEPL